MPDKAALAALIERVERGEAPTREDKRVVWRLMGWRPNRNNSGWYLNTPTGFRDTVEVAMPDPWTSIDAQAALPGEVTAARMPYVNDVPRPWEAHAANGKIRATGYAPTECAARLAAKLRAMMEKPDVLGGGDG